jgi:hypothetical protein
MDHPNGLPLLAVSQEGPPPVTSGEHSRYRQGFAPLRSALRPLTAPAALIVRRPAGTGRQAAQGGMVYRRLRTTGPRRPDGRRANRAKRAVSAFARYSSNLPGPSGGVLRGPGQRPGGASRPVSVAISVCPAVPRRSPRTRLSRPGQGRRSRPEGVSGSESLMRSAMLHPGDRRRPFVGGLGGLGGLVPVPSHTCARAHTREAWKIVHQVHQVHQIRLAFLL